MQNDSMPHCDIATYRKWLTFIGMQHTAILNISACSYGNGVDISTHNSIEPDIYFSIQPHVSNNLRGICNPCALCNFRDFIIKLINWHTVFSCVSFPWHLLCNHAKV